MLAIHQWDSQCEVKGHGIYSVIALETSPSKLQV